MYLKKSHKYQKKAYSVKWSTTSTKFIYFQKIKIHGTSENVTSFSPYEKRGLTYGDFHETYRH